MIVNFIAFILISDVYEINRNYELNSAMGLAERGRMLRKYYQSGIEPGGHHDLSCDYFNPPCDIPRKCGIYFSYFSYERSLRSIPSELSSPSLGNNKNTRYLHEVERPILKQAWSNMLTELAYRAECQCLINRSRNSSFAALRLPQRCLYENATNGS